MIKLSETFSYAGIDSLSTYGIRNITIDSGMMEESFLSPIELKEVEIYARETPYFQGIKRKPLTLQLSFGFNEPWDKNKLRQVKRWLTQKYYSPLIFSDDPEKIYYAILIDSPSIVYNENSEGYIGNLTFRCDSPFAYSSPITTQTYISTISSNFTITNNGDLPCSPIITITVNAGNSFSIVNQTTNKTMSFNNLAVGEIITIDCSVNEDIKTSLPDMYRFDNMTGDFIDLDLGDNTFQINGSISVQLKYELKYL